MQAICPIGGAQMATQSRIFSASSRAGSPATTAPAVAGDGEIFRERVQADNGVPPGRIVEEGVRRRLGGAKRAVGLVDDEGEIVRLCECGELGDPLGWDGDPGGIAGADQDDGGRAFIDQRCARLGIRDQTVVVGDAASLDLLDVEPHAVVEVEGVLHEHVVAGSGEADATMQNAWLQPAVMSTSSATTSPP